MEIQIRIDRASDNTWSIMLVPMPVGNVLIGEELPPPYILQTGYADQAEAVNAFVECLTTAPPDPPDLAPYDDALLKLGQLIEEVSEITLAMPQVGQRLNEIEDAVEALKSGTGSDPQPPRRSKLLPGREVASASSIRSTPRAAGQGSAPLPIRRPRSRTNELPEERRGLSERVHGQFFGGVSRRGGTAAPAGIDPGDEGGE